MGRGQLLRTARRAVFLLLCVLSILMGGQQCCAGSPGVVINEVFYDPAGSDGGKIWMMAQVRNIYPGIKRGIQYTFPLLRLDIMTVDIQFYCFSGHFFPFKWAS